METSVDLPAPTVQEVSGSRSLHSFHSLSPLGEGEETGGKRSEAASQACVEVAKARGEDYQVREGGGIEGAKDSEGGCTEGHICRPVPPFEQQRARRNVPQVL